MSSSHINRQDLAVRAFIYGTAEAAKQTDPVFNPPLSQKLTIIAEEEEELKRKARDEGVREGEQRARARMTQEMNALRESINHAVEQFAKSRDHYFHHVEGDVVRLAMAIAQKILHRESQLEPLLLKGAVHVALEKVAANTEVTLRVAPGNEAAWISHFSMSSQNGPKVNVVSDTSLSGEACALETSVGKIELSVEGQLQEIEQGFFDLLGRRPVSK